MDVKPTYEELEKRLAILEGELNSTKHILSSRVENVPGISIDFYKKIFSTNPSSITVSELNTGKFTDVNDTFLEVTGYSREEVIGKTSLELKILTEKDRILLTNNLHKGIYNLESVIYGKNGKQIHCILAIRIINISGTNYLLIIGNDVELQKKIEEKTKQHLDELFAIFNGFEGNTYVVDFESYEILAVNKFTEEHFGSDLVGDKCYYRFHNNQAGPCDFCSNKLLQSSLLKEGTPFIREIFNKKTNKWYHCFAKAIPWTDGRLVRMEISIDITERKIIEQQLQESLDLNNKTLASSVIGILAYNADSGQCILANQSAATTLGATTEGLLKQNFRNITSWKNSGLLNIAEEVLETNSDKKYLTQINSSFGKTVWLNCHLNTFESNGKRDLLLTFEDFTEFKNTEEGLQLSERKYKALVSQLPDIVIVHKESKILFINEAAKSMLGFAPDEIIGSFLKDFIHPDDYLKAIEIGQLRRQGLPVPEAYEIRIKSNFNTWIWVEVRGEIIDYGDQMAVLTVVTDLTHRKKTEEALQKSEEKFRNLVEHAADGVFHSDSKGNFIGVNSSACTMTGYSEDELLSMNMNNLFSLEEKSKKPLRYDLLLQGDIVRNERIITRKDGSSLEIEMNTKMMPDGTYQAFFRDFSERKKLETENILAKEKAEESDRLKSAFLANMSHEIRTPLNGILGFAEILLDNELAPEKRMEFLSIINSNGRQLLAIINDIIDISKIEAGQVKINFIKCFLNQFMYELYSYYHTECIETLNQDVEIKLNIPFEKSILVYTDDVRIKQILTNLIGNSLKFTKKGFIEFGYSVDSENYSITFFVKDTGIGLSAEKQQLIFERFRQADDTTTRKYGGTGLGLAISKGLVELMEGKIWVESTVGNGSSFFFTIPYKPVIINENSSRNSGNLKTFFNWENKTILVVEDDFDSYLYLETLLGKTNAKILCVENGLAAIDICIENKTLDLILMDIQTPVMNGYEATKEIRKFNKLIPIIAQTANAFEEDKERCIDAGCNDFIAKPIDVKVLFPLIDKYFTK